MKNKEFVPLLERESINIQEFKNRTCKYSKLHPLQIARLVQRGIKYKNIKVKKETDVLECLKEYEKWRFIPNRTRQECCKCNKLYDVICCVVSNNKIKTYCQFCRFKEVIGIIPEEKVKEE